MSVHVITWHRIQYDVITYLCHNHRCTKVAGGLCNKTCSTCDKPRCERLLRFYLVPTCWYLYVMWIEPNQPHWPACLFSGTKHINLRMSVFSFYTHRFNKVERGVYWFRLVRLSFRLSVRLWTESCPLYIFNNTCRINVIFVHLIEQLEKVCLV